MPACMVKEVLRHVLTFADCRLQWLFISGDFTLWAALFFFLFLILFIFGCGGSSLWCAGFSLWWLLLLWSMGSRAWASVLVAHGLHCSTACGILPDQGSNPCLLHWPADPLPLSHQKSPGLFLLTHIIKKKILCALSHFSVLLSDVVAVCPWKVWGPVKKKKKKKKAGEIALTFYTPWMLPWGPHLD